MSELDAKVNAAAAAIWRLWLEGRRADGLPQAIRPRTREEGMAVQAALAELAGPVAGWKIAATSTAGQAHIGVGGPLAGRLFERFLHRDGATLPSSNMYMKVVEAEFAFRLGFDLPGGGPLSRDTVLAAVAAVHLAIEIPDSRFERFELVGAEQLLADDACAGRFVLGPEVADWSDVDMPATEVVLTIGGRCVGTGRGANVLGDPRDALVWLANEVGRAGAPLQAGQVVTTGTITVPPAVKGGDHVVADFGELGSVEVVFAT